MHFSLINFFNFYPNLTTPHRKFLKVIISAFIACNGKANYRNLSRYCDVSEKTISRWFSKGFKYIGINSALLFFLPEKHKKIMAIDASFIEKSGKKTNGIDYFWSGCDGKSKKGLEMSIISIVDVTANTAYALDARQTIPALNKNRVDCYIEHFNDSATTIKEHSIKYVVADSYYSKIKFVNAVCMNGLSLISKIRSDSDLQYVFTGEQSGRGRPKKYDGKIKFDDLSKFKYEYSEDDIVIYSIIAHSIVMKKKIKIVLLKNTINNCHALLFSTDLSLQTNIIIKYYKSRFQIEFLIRDSKQHTGISDCQARSSNAINTHFNLSMMSLNVIKIEDCINKNSFEKSVKSIQSFKQKIYNKHYINGILSMLDISKDTIKYQQIHDKFSNYGVISP